MKRRSKHGYIGTARIIDSHSSKVADLEPLAVIEPLAACKTPLFTSPVDLFVCSNRARLCDPDGVSAKYVIDALVHCRVIADDSSNQIKEVRYSQSKVKNQTDEETWIKLVVIEDRLLDHLPDWKRGILEASSMATNAEPRFPVK